jgi:serine/threonine-protein kinase
MEPERLSHFRILGKIGEGGMGVVYRAEDEKLRRPVALKLLAPAFAADEERRRRFLREAQAAAAVRHPAIAAIYEVGEDGDAAFIAMELVEGRTLRTMLDADPPTVSEAARIVTELARGLERAHSSGVIHRDLKPDNVMIEPDGRVKILDFGLAKLLEAPGTEGDAGLSQRATRAADLTREGSLVGTAAYMSPEQARGQGLDLRSDLFSLGVLFYELLTGRHPFRGVTPMDTLSAILKVRPAAASAVNPDVPPALEAVLERLLAKEPGDRLPSASALVSELEAAASASTPIAERGGAAQPSVAVLPFVDMSPDKDQDYFCEGIAEELIGALGRVPGLRVAARTSAFQFKGRADDVRRIGQQLNVEAVLEGSVRKAGNRLRVTAQLVSTKDGYQLWSERYDRETEDVFAIQDEIAATLVETLKIRLADAQAPRGRRATEDLEAYHLYLQGRYWWNKRHEGGLWKSVDFFAQAIARDPSYALAHAGLADAHSVIGYYAFLPPRAAFAKAKQAAEKALGLDDRLPEAHVSTALVRFWFDWDWAGAEQAFRRSLERNPHHVPAHIFLGQLLAAIGRVDEARGQWQAALELDPMSPLTNGIVASGLYFARHYEAGLARCRKALELDPNHIQSLWTEAFTCGQLGRFDEGIEAAERAASLSGRAPIFLGTLGLLLALAGRGDQARALVRELESRSTQEYVGPHVLASIHAGLGQKPETLDCLERAYEERNSMMMAVAAMREFDFLRGEDRFDRLLKRLNLRLRDR